MLLYVRHSPFLFTHATPSPSLLNTSLVNIVVFSFSSFTTSNLLYKVLLLCLPSNSILQVAGERSGSWFCLVAGELSRKVGFQVKLSL